MSKLEDDLVVYTSIEPFTDDTNSLYKLSALMCVDKSYIAPHLEFTESKEESWDAEYYLLNMLEMFRKWKTGNLEEKELKFKAEIEQVIPEEHFEDLLLMFEKADKLGFFNEIKEKK